MGVLSGSVGKVEFSVGSGGYVFVSSSCHHNRIHFYSIRRRALDVAFYMCNQDSANEFVQELLEYLKTADFQIREELVFHFQSLSSLFFRIPHFFKPACRCTFEGPMYSQ